MALLSQVKSSGSYAPYHGQVQIRDSHDSQCEYSQSVVHRTNEVAQRALMHSKKQFSKPLGIGAAKKVWNFDEHHVVIEPTKSGKRAEVVEDFDTAEKIRQSANGWFSHLAVDKPCAQDKANGIYLTKKASGGDLDGDFKSGKQDRTMQGGQMLLALTQLHDAGYVHGDLKPENFLLYEGRGGRKILKLADWGKAKKLGPRQTATYSGNRMFIPGEKQLSHKSEVFSAGLLLINILEQPLLHLSDDGMLCKPKYLDPKGSADKKATGVAKYLSLSSKCPQNCSSLGRGKSQNISDEQREELDNYIDALCLSYNLPGLDRLLKAMTDPDPRNRPTMRQAAIEYRRILQNCSAPVPHKYML